MTSSTWRQTMIEPFQGNLLDQKLLSILQKDCRISNTDIAHTLRISKASVAYRIARLEDKKVIQGYQTHIDIFKLGFRGAVIRFSVKGTIAKQKQFVEALARHPQILTVYTAFRPCNVMAGIAYENAGDISAFLTFVKKEGTISNYEITELQGYSPMAMDYFQKNTEIISRKTKRVALGKETFTLNSLHVALLHHLSQNARMTVTDLSERTKTHKSTVKNALHELVSHKVITKFSASVNPYSIPGTFLAAWWMSLPDEGEVKRLQTWLQEKKCSNGFVRVVGKYNSLAFTFFHSPQALMAFEETLSEKFPFYQEYKMEFLKEQLKLEWFPSFIEEKIVERLKRDK